MEMDGKEGTLRCSRGIIFRLIRKKGTFTPAMRNYLLSHTSSVFEQSYQARHFGKDLAKLCFGPKAGEHDELFKALRNSFLDRDENAPLYPTDKYLEMFEKRNNLQALRKPHQEARLRDPRGSDGEQARNLRGKIQWLTNGLAPLAVEELRQKYFREADRLRSQGLSTDGIVQRGQPDKSCNAWGTAAARKIGESFRRQSSPHSSPANASIHFTDVLQLYLSDKAREAEILADEAMPSWEEPSSAEPEPLYPAKAPLNKPFRCLIGCGWFFSRHTLSRHNTKVH
jgi:hypothetical protein